VLILPCPLSETTKKKMVMVEPTSREQVLASTARAADTRGPGAAGRGGAGGRGGVKKIPSEKRRQGELRRETRRATIKGMMEAAIQTIPGEDKVVYEKGAAGGRDTSGKKGRAQTDEAWQRHRRMLDQGVLRDTMETKFEKMMKFKKVTEERTKRIAESMTFVSRRKGRRTLKHMPLKQRNALEAQEEYVLSGKKEEAQAKKDNELRHKRAALQVLSDNLRAMGVQEEAEPLTKAEKKLGISMGKTRGVLADPNKRLLDLGRGNVTLEYENLLTLALEAQEEFDKKLAALKQQAPFLKSPLYSDFA
jgi:hypothetical protein